MKLKIKTSTFTKVQDIVIPDIFYRRLKCGIQEFDSMFGSGLLPGSSLTFTGQAGSGKTTALLQYMEALAGNGYNVGYASGEENKYQLAFTCKRLNVKSVNVANETDIDTLAASMEDFDVLVVDSFQALTTTKKLNSAADKVAPSQPARLFVASSDVEAWNGLGSRGEWDRRATAISNAPRSRATAAASRTTRSRITGLQKPTPPPESRVGHSTRRNGGRCCSTPF